jgi:23S rRNA pseudouridine955/2504/2580 synthase
MKQYAIDEQSAGQRLDRFLSKRFPAAGKGFLQKMVRKKQIVVNGTKADPARLLITGDQVMVYFSDATIAHFEGVQRSLPLIPDALTALFRDPVFEDDALIAVNKPAGVLTQPDAGGEASIADAAALWFGEHHDTFHPAPANRLDRNTSGVILIPKTYPMQREIAAAISGRTIIKEYLTLVSAQVTAPLHLEDTLIKDADTNVVSRSDSSQDGQRAVLQAQPLARSAGTTLLRVMLFTGRTHQIRVQLAGAGCPVVGDPKYGDADVNARFKQACGLRRQLLHSARYALPDLGYDIQAPLPGDFKEILLSLGYKEVI